MKPESLVEFRVIYNTLFGRKKTLDLTPEVLSHPLYSRYKVLAPEFYEMMYFLRKKVGLSV